MSIAIVFAGLATGLLLGILGSGGSIITLPALVYLLDVAPKPAIAMSLGIVGLTASIATVHHFIKGNVNVPVALVFSIFGAMGTYGGARLGVLMPETLQLGLFAVIMYLAAYQMLKNAPAVAVPARVQSDGTTSSGNETLSGRRLGHIAGHGIVVGMLTGMVGVGGGFLIVPSLVLLSNIPMKQAIGTSLAIIAVKSFAGFAGYAGSIAIDYTLMATFVAVAITGGVAGGYLCQYISARLLKKSFAVFLMVVATYIVFREFLN